MTSATRSPKTVCAQIPGVPGWVRAWSRRAILPVAVLACCAQMGCPEAEPKPTVLALTGVVERIDHEQRAVQVRYRSPDGTPVRSVVVRLTEDTEIQINGVLSTLEDVREDEVATGTVRIDHVDDVDTYTALRVKITR
jgi:hypothetical protein